MMNKQINVRAAVVSHIGCIRKNNEDNFFANGDLMEDKEVNAGAVVTLDCQQANHLFAVCDGMGGLNGGEYASSIGVHSVKKLYGQLRRKILVEKLRDFCVETSQQVYEDAQRRKIDKEGTTLAMLLIQGRIATSVNVGDSRVYILRLGKLIQVSHDHTMVYNQMLNGHLTREEMRKHPHGNVINQYLGMPKSSIQADYMYYRDFMLCNGDRFIICTDGVSDLLSDQQMEDIINSSSEPMDVAKALVMSALEMGGKDNATCIVGDICSEYLPIQTPSDLQTLSIAVSTQSTKETTVQL